MSSPADADPRSSEDGPQLICAGEAVIDLIPEGDAYRPVAGGASFNAARAAARLGAPTGFMGALSRDPLGARLVQAAAADGVDLRHAVRTDKPTPLSLADLTGGDASYTIYHRGTAGEALTPTRLGALPVTARAVLIGGISLVHAPAAETLERLAYNRPAGVTLCLDVNIRPALIDDPGPYRARLLRLLAVADIVKISDEDQAWLDVASGSVAPQALLLRSHGADGATARQAALTVRLPAPRVRVRDTVGAGDTFIAAWLAHGLRSGSFRPDTEDGLRQALSYALCAASLSVTRLGADPPTHEQVLCAL